MISIVCYILFKVYDREKIQKQILEIIPKEEITFFGDLALFVAPALSTLYEWKLDKSEEIKEAIETQRSKIKRKMRKKWLQSDNATLQIVGYRLMATQEELAAITTNRIESKVEANITGGITIELDHGCEPIKQEDQSNSGI